MEERDKQAQERMEAFLKEMEFVAGIILGGCVVVALIVSGVL